MKHRAIMEVDHVSKFDRWRLNAPADYQFSQDSVLYEKTQSFLTGVMLGALAGIWLTIALLWIGGHLL